MEAKRKFGRGALALVVKAVISGGLLYLAFRLVDLRTVGENLRRAEPTWITAGFALFAFQVCMAAVRWRYVAAGCKAEVPLSPLVRFSAIGTFFNQTLPSTFGGDAVRVWLLGRHGTPWRAATYSVLLDRFAGFVVLAVMIGVCLPWSLRLITVGEGRVATTLLVLATACAIVLFLSIGGRLPAWLDGINVIRHIHALARAARHVLLHGKVAMRVGVISTAIHIITVLAVFALAQALNLALPFWSLFLIILPVLLVIMLPVSIAGWGVREGAMIVAFGYAGLPQDQALALSILFGLVMLGVGALGGLVWVLAGAPWFSRNNQIAVEG